MAAVVSTSLASRPTLKSFRIPTGIRVNASVSAAEILGRSPRAAAAQLPVVDQELLIKKAAIEVFKSVSPSVDRDGLLASIDAKIGHAIDISEIAKIVGPLLRGRDSAATIISEFQRIPTLNDSFNSAKAELHESTSSSAAESTHSVAEETPEYVAFSEARTALDAAKLNPIAVLDQELKATFGVSEENLAAAESIKSQIDELSAMFKTTDSDGSVFNAALLELVGTPDTAALGEEDNQALKTAINILHEASGDMYLFASALQSDAPILDALSFVNTAVERLQ
jgi:hypothetical protein